METKTLLDEIPAGEADSIGRALAKFKSALVSAYWESGPADGGVRDTFTMVEGFNGEVDMGKLVGAALKAGFVEFSADDGRVGLTPSAKAAEFRRGILETWRRKLPFFDHHAEMMVALLADDPESSWDTMMTIKRMAGEGVAYDPVTLSHLKANHVAWWQAATEVAEVSGDAS